MEFQEYFPIWNQLTKDQQELIQKKLMKKLSALMVVSKMRSEPSTQERSNSWKHYLKTMKDVKKVLMNV